MKSRIQDGLRLLQAPEPGDGGNRAPYIRRRAVKPHQACQFIGFIDSSSANPLFSFSPACCPLFSYYFDCCWSVSPLRDKHRFIPPSLGATYEFLDLEFALLITYISHINFKCSWKHAVPRLPTFQQYFSAKFVGQTDFSVLGAPASRLYLSH